MHYSQTSDGDGDADKDASLPFKSHNECSSTFVADVKFNNYINLFENPGVRKSETKFHNQDDFLTSSYLSAIWQPPKIS